MQTLLQNSTAQELLFQMIDSTDHISGKTGLTPTVTIRKAGGTFASPAGAISQIANGWYKVAGNAGDTNTLGPLLLHATASGADPTDVLYLVGAADPLIGALSATALTDIASALDSTVMAATVGTNLDALVSTRATQTLLTTVAGYVDTEIAAIKAKTDLLPSVAMLCDADGRLIVDAHKVKFVIAGTTETVYRLDGTTISYTKTLTTDADALPIIGN